MEKNIKTYKILDGEVILHYGKIYCTSKNVKEFVESVFSKLEEYRLKLLGKVNERSMRNGCMLDCTSCSHSITRVEIEKRDGSSMIRHDRYCTIKNSFVDKEFGKYCIFHSRKLGMISIFDIMKLRKFFDDFGEINREYVLETLSKSANSFNVMLNEVYSLIK